MSEQPILLFIEGHPRPAGSKMAVALYKGPRGAPKEKREYTGKAIAIDSAGDKGQMWRLLVADEVKKKIGKPLEGAVHLRATFYLHRPKKHYYTGAKEQQLRPDAPEHHTQAPDTTKLLRAIEDALKGVAWADDAQINFQVGEKLWACRWGERQGVLLRITLAPMTPRLTPIRTDLNTEHRKPPRRQRMTENGLRPKQGKDHGSARLVKEHSDEPAAAETDGHGGSRKRRRPKSRRAPPRGTPPAAGAG